MNLLNTRQAASYLGLTASTLESWRSRGGSPVFIKLGKAVRYSEADLDDFKASRKRTNTGHKEKV